MFSTLPLRTSGKDQVSEFDACRNEGAVRNSMGIVFQDPTFDDRPTGKENLGFCGMMYGMITLTAKEAFSPGS